ncbi:MAG TPA: tetraacyldisaccharide 4'-kinase [Steroidobacteraceae bacterium]|nr:tetraacyldisaccharide 4'-kinase [Steroidobacteraceae bacterium]
MQDWLLQTWYGGTRRGAWLLPAAWLFAAVAGLRRWLYAAGVLSRYRSPRPVVVVGNVTVGGTGKTPLIIWLAGQLRLRGRRVGVVSRGYGRSSPGTRRILPSDPVAETGDEPALISRRSGVSVAVGSDRPAAVRLLEGDCDVILSDDGLQHYALERDAEVIVVDGRRGLGNARRLPAGPLREAPTRLAEAGAVVINDEGFQYPGSLRMRMEPIRFVNVVSGDCLPVEAFSGQRAHAIAAIGHPERFFGLLRGLSIDVDARALPDHAVPSAAQLSFGDGLPVLMTEKDAVKCAGIAGPAHWYLEVGAAFSPADAERLLAVVEDACRRRTPRD